MMKKIMRFITCLIIVMNLILPLGVYAREGDCGYEGGISSGDVAGKITYEYQEINFVSGKPVLFKGSLTIKKSLKQDLISATYTYDLKNIDLEATLKRTLVYNTKLTQKDNKQTVEQTSIYGKPIETIKIKNNTYTLDSYDFTRTNLVDAKPAINYYAGNISGKKVYKVGTSTTGTGSSSTAGTITVNVTGKFYGYDQYWGTSEVEELNYIIQSEKKNGDKVDKWGGTANVTLSSTMTKQIKYIENEPNEISFDGGYVQTQNNNSVLEYTSKLPEFDASDVASDNMVTLTDTLKIDTFPMQTRLPVPNLNHLKGHWSENDIKMLYSLEIFKGNDSIFDPGQYMTRAEFAQAIVRAAKEVPIDPALQSKTTQTSASGKNNTVESPFSDVSTDNIYFNDINSAYTRGLFNGKGISIFSPEDHLTLAEALTIFVRALGLEGIAPSSGALTSFRDNDLIPSYARNSASAAEKIGLIYGDDRGYLKPNDKLTKARAAALLNRFIGYMRDGIKKDYRDRAMGI